jgi:hypothetical protein
MSICEQENCKKKACFGFRDQTKQYCATHKKLNMIDLSSKVCENESCSTRATFGFLGQNTRFCSTHKVSGMIDLKNKKCAFEGCNKINPCFDLPDGKGKFCKKHKLASMIDVKSKKCSSPGCLVQPIFDYMGGKGRYCREHKLDNMVDVKNKRCKFNNCTSINPAFDFKGGKGQFCCVHKLPNMINVKSPKCDVDNCNLQPTYNYSGCAPLYCKAHKKEDMINVKTLRCKVTGCNCIPSYNFSTETTAIYCLTHKTDGMVNIKSKKCEFKNCIKQPTYDFVGNKGRFCVEHKENGMIDVKHLKCQFNNCKKRATFGKDKSTFSIFCSIHKENGMINLSRLICNYEECNITAWYGIPGHPPSSCSKHKKKGMIRKPTAKCKNCNESAKWGINWTPRHCDNHKLPEDENLTERPCISCGLPYILDKLNKCENCNPQSWESARLAKQNALMNFLDNNGNKGSSTDIIIDGGICGRERPDRVFDLGDKILILECDEFQHRSRACDCEQTRMVNIGQSFGGIPVYFIRWNPDEYCPFYENKKNESISHRHKLCCDFISDIKNGRVSLPTALVSVIYLYYDGWISLNEEKWKIITPIQ